MAIYHVMARGNRRQDIVLDDKDRRRWMDALERTVVARGWEFFAFVLMFNRFHLFLRAPEPELSRGMHRMLSAYATRRVRRHRRPGHVFQGRFRAQLIEDESYVWTVDDSGDWIATRSTMPSRSTMGGRARRWQGAGIATGRAPWQRIWPGAVGTSP
jgi:REP element-mobilizing transposase RayT